MPKDPLVVTGNAHRNVRTGLGIGEHAARVEKQDIEPKTATQVETQQEDPAEIARRDQARRQQERGVVADVVRSSNAPANKAGGSSMDIRLGRIAPPTSTDAPAHVGPLEDFQPTSGVWMHALLRDTAYARALTKEFGMRVGYVLRDQDASKADPSEYWMQDLAPKRLKEPDGTTKLVGTLSPFPRRSAYFGGGHSNPMKPELTFHQSPYKPVISTGPPEGTWAKHELLPLVLEGGNVVASGGKVFITDKVLRDNAKDWAREHGLQHLGPSSGYKPRGADEVKHMIGDAYGVGRDNVVVLPSMPGERTGHSDMFILPIAPGVVAIPQIRDDAFDVVGFEHERGLGRTVQEFLERMTSQLEQLGLKVERMPMMPPVFLEPTADGYQALFATPAQTTLFDVDGVKRSFVPTLRYDGFGDAYRSKAAAYTAETAALMEKYGFPARTYDATEIFEKKGGGHCVSTPSP